MITQVPELPPLPQAPWFTIAHGWLFLPRLRVKLSTIEDYKIEVECVIMNTISHCYRIQANRPDGVEYYSPEHLKEAEALFAALDDYFEGPRIQSTGPR